MPSLSKSVRAIINVCWHSFVLLSLLETFELISRSCARNLTIDIKEGDHLIPQSDP